VSAKNETEHHFEKKTCVLPGIINSFVIKGA